jgi:hypothetical protein
MEDGSGIDGDARARGLDTSAVVIGQRLEKSIRGCRFGDAGATHRFLSRIKHVSSLIASRLPAHGMSAYRQSGARARTLTRR